MTVVPETKIFEHELSLSSISEPANATFQAKQAYWTFGDPRNPAVLLPSCFGGKLADTLPLLYSSEEASAPLPSSKYYVIVTALLGGGESSSPSNTPAPFDGANFPHTSYEDNIRLQHALCTQQLGLSKLFAYIGFSMGGQQAYHMAVLYPDFAENVVSIASSARTSWHNWCFLEGPKHALTSAVDFQGGNYTQPPRIGMKAFSRVYSTWALSPQWFRHESWREAGCGSLPEYLDKHWSGREGADANDLLAMLWTWQKGDITSYFPEDAGDLAKTLGRIRARCLVMPSRTDQYFPPEDSVEEVRHLKRGQFSCIETVWGHVAGGGSGSKGDGEFIKEEVRRFLGL